MTRYNPGDHVRAVREISCESRDESGVQVGELFEPVGSVLHVISQEESGEVLLDGCCVGEWYVYPDDLEPATAPLSDHQTPGFRPLSDITNPEG